jgi:hypothetical protein
MDSGKDSHSFGVVRFERGLMVTNDEGRRECNSRARGSVPVGGSSRSSKL